MTLIAGFKAFGVPILIGDFVLTVRGERAGVRKKAHKIAPNCSIAWTGHRIPAEQIFRVLRQRFTGGTITREELEETLTGFKEADFNPLSVNLIGWIITEEQLCFRWRSDWPYELFYGAPLYDGSGGEVIQKFAGASEIYDVRNPNVKDLELAIDTCLTFTTNRMSLEMAVTPDRLTFGHSYEILYFADCEFHYVNDILYLALAIRVDEQGGLASVEFHNVFYKYRVFGEYSVTERHEQERGTRIDIIQPLGVDSKTVALELSHSLTANYQFQMASQFYCIFLRIFSPDYASPPMALLERANVRDENRLIHVEDDGLSFRLPDAFIKWIYDTIKADSASS